MVEQVPLANRKLLSMAGERKEKLRLKRRAAALGIKIGQERIVRLIEDDRGVEPSGQTLGERRLAEADRSFNRQVPEVQGPAKLP